MSRTIDHYERYNKLVKLVTRMDADKYPAARLILHVMEAQFEKTGSPVFDGNTYFIEADAGNQFENNIAEFNAQRTISQSWVDALNEFANVPKTQRVKIEDMIKEYDALDTAQLAFANALIPHMYSFNGDATSWTKAVNAKNTTSRGEKTSIPVNGRDGQDIAVRLNLAKIYGTSERQHPNGPTNAAINGVFGGPAKYAGNGRNMSFKPDKAILTQLLDRAYQQASAKSTGPTSTNFFSGSSSGTVPDDKDIIFYRKMGDSNALYRRVGGVEMRVEKGSEEFMKLRDDGNCYNTGYTDNTTNVTCADLVTKCLKGQNIADCKDFMKSINWNDQLKNEEINPDIALDLLRKFGFGTKTVAVNEIGRNLQMIEDYDEWISNLTKNFVGNSTGQLSADDLTRIAQNTALTGYLKKLISLINKNPGILNRDYVGKVNLTQNPNAFASTQLGRFGLLPKQVVAASGVPSMSSVLSLQNAVMSNRNQIGMSWGVMPQGVIFQMGGGMSSGIAEVLENAQNNSTFPLKLSKLMEESFKSFVTSLKSHGKDLDSGDKNHIHTLINELKDKEDKLFKAAIYTDKYVRLIGALGQTDSTNTISIDHAKQFVDRRNSYFSKVGKKQDDLFSILKALAEAQQQETTVESKTVTDYPRF